MSGYLASLSVWKIIDLQSNTVAHRSLTSSILPCGVRLVSFDPLHARDRTAFDRDAFEVAAFDVQRADRNCEMTLTKG
jgi:hypothetical protein